MKAQGSAKQKLKEALRLCNYHLYEPTEDQKKRLGLEHRRCSVFQVMDENGAVLCTYSTLEQIRKFAKKKIESL